MSRWIVTGWYRDGGSVLYVINHQNTAIRRMEELLAKGLTKVHLYEEMRPCTDPDIKQRARALTETLKAEQSSQNTSLSGLYAWWHSPQGSSLCEGVST